MFCNQYLNRIDSHPKKIVLALDRDSQPNSLVLDNSRYSLYLIDILYKNLTACLTSHPEMLVLQYHQSHYLIQQPSDKSVPTLNGCFLVLDQVEIVRRCRLHQEH